LKNFFYYNAGNGENMVYLGIKNIAMLKSMKKPDPKPTPEQLKMAKRLKDVQSKQRKSPEGQQFMAELRLKNQEASKALKNKADERKYISEMDMDARAQDITDRIEKEKGEGVFGPDYKDLGLKRERVRTSSGPQNEFRKKWDDEANAPYHERYERVSPTQDVVRVYRSKGKDPNWGAGLGKSTAPYGTSVKDENAFDPRTGERAIVYERKIGDIARENRERYKARIKAIADRGEAEAKRMIAEEAAKAKAKAGGK
jgi:hypothetical protein